MNLVPIGFLSLTLLALADGFILPQGGGFGGISGIFSILIIILFVAALAQQNNNTTTTAQCTANYIPTPNDVTSCIRFVSTPTKSFADARAACQGEGGDLLTLSTATFPPIHQLAQDMGGTCDYWVGAEEPAADGDWNGLDSDTIPITEGIFFSDHLNGAPNSGGLMDHLDDFFLVGSPKSGLNCYICQKDI